MMQINENLLDDISVFFDDSKSNSIVLAHLILNLIYADEPLQTRKKIAIEIQNLGCPDYIRDKNTLVKFICNPENFLNAFIQDFQCTNAAIKIAKDLFSLQSSSDIVQNKHNLRSDNMTIISAFFIICCLAIAWFLFIKRQNSICRQAEIICRKAIEANSANSGWCRKIMGTFDLKDWNWKQGFDYAALSSDERRLAVQYLLSYDSKNSIQSLTPEKGELFDPNTMIPAGERLHYVYELVVPGLVIDGNVVVKSEVLCATADFMTIEKIGDDKFREYCLKETPDAYKERKIVFSSSFCGAMGIVFKDTLPMLLEKICSASYDKSLQKTKVVIGADYDLSLMDAEELSVPENAVVARVFCQGLIRGGKLILKPHVSVKEKR